MKNGYIKTAAATPYITVADCNANGNEIIRLIHEMEKEHVKVMTFPELCITGYTCQDLFLQRRLLDSAWETLLKITKETADVDALVFVGVPFRNHGKLYNVAAVLNRGEIIGLVPKTYLPNYGEFYEQRHFASGLGCLEYVDIEGIEPEVVGEREFLSEQIFFLSVRRSRSLWQQQRSVRIYG